MTEAPEWTLVYEGVDPELEGRREALCALGNGRFVTRGAAEESEADGVHYPGTYFAGGYDRLVTEVAGRAVVNEDLVNFPNWLPLTFRPERGQWLAPGAQELLSHRQVLDMREGVLTRELRVRDDAGRETRIRSRRIVHMENPHLAAIEYSITPENWAGRVEVRSMLDGRVVNAGVPRYGDLASKHLETVALGSEQMAVWLLVRTLQSRLEVALAACTRAWRGDEEIDAERRLVEDSDRIGTQLGFDLAQGETARIEKIVALYTSRDPAVSEASLEAREALPRAGRFATLLRSHALAWRALWRRCDIRLDPAGDEQRILRLHIFHMLQTVSLHTIGRDVSVPARGWHGEAYRGHIFWDELFVFPFYNLRFSTISRSLLLYRYRRLSRARWAARQEGYLGAMFPWQSGSSGQEETQVVHYNPADGSWGADLSHRQRHVGAAIAYNVWQYYSVTGDREFLLHYGAEMLLEIARFFGSLTTLVESTGRYEIHGVMGPDEYSETHPEFDEPGLRNNAYTNVMAVWVLERALEVMELLPARRVQEIAERVGLAPEEVERWHDILRRMTVPLHGDGVISQFEGYDRLLQFDWERYRRRYGNVTRLDRILKAEGDSPDRYQLSKQADVLMLFYLLGHDDLRRIFERLGYPFSDDTLRRAIDYYLPRTSHGSTLSYVVHASVLDEVQRDVAWEMFKEALRSDINDAQGGTTREGIHLGAIGGTVDIVFRHYVGLDAADGVISFRPRLPTPLRSLRLQARHRGRWYGITVTQDRFILQVEAGWTGLVPVRVFGKLHLLEPGARFEMALGARSRQLSRRPARSAGPRPPGGRGDDAEQ
jgi:trehalose/maltose hydrolase-like predicted phosphorylase